MLSVRTGHRLHKQTSDAVSVHQGIRACRSKSRPARVLRPLRAQAETRQQQQPLAGLEEDSNTFGESFYDILSVPSTADARTIKRAYLVMMMEVHPDRNNSDSESEEFSALLNAIYETLRDPARRSLYDALTGFSEDSINPFADPAAELDQVFVDEFACIGCHDCVSVCPKTFALEPDFGRARVMKQSEDTPDKLQEAIDTCPVSCIQWVSSPQLSLLEAAMARMERVAVWSMSMGSGAGLDVFRDASMAWHKRQTMLRDRRAAAGASSAPTGMWWNNVVSMEGAAGASMYNRSSAAHAQRQRDAADRAYGNNSRGERSAPLGDKESRAVASLAAKAARASRTWRLVQEAAARGRNATRRSLSSTSSASSMDEDDAVLVQVRNN